MSASNTMGSPRRSTAQGRDFESKLVKFLCELYGIIIIINHFYIALFSAFEQTYCDRM